MLISSDNKRDKYESFLLSKYQTIPNHTKEELENIPKPEHPHLATFQNFFMSLDPVLGYVPSERLHEAFKETRNIQRQNSDSRSINWESVPSNMGGRTRAIMFDPNDPSNNKVWAAGVTGGLWYNDDISNIDSRWVAVNDFWDNLSVSQIIYDPLDTETFYVATGEANTALITYRESSSRGIGIWKSNDAGLTWSLLPSTADFQYVTDMAAKQVNNGVEIYASVVSGTYQGQDHESAPSDGLFKSLNGGQTWTQVLPDIPSTDIPYSPSDIEITASGNIIVGTMKNLDGDGGAVILTSTTGDYDSWSISNQFQLLIESNSNYNIPGRIIFSSCASNPNIVYGVVGSGFLNNMGFNLSYGNYIIKSFDGGLSWQTVNLPTSSGDDWASLAWHALEIKVSPVNPDIVFVGGLELYRSDDGGISWSNLSDWDLMYYGGGDRYVHADIHKVAFQPGNPNTIAVTSDGGVFYSENSLSSNPVFIERNQGYNTLQFYTCDILDDNQNTYMVGGLQDNGTLFYDGGDLDINDMISGGDGAFCFFDDNDPLLITSTYYNAWYFFNLDNNSVEYGNGNSGVFINPSDYDSDNNILYANKVRFNGSQANRIIKLTNIESDPNITTINLGTTSPVYFSNLKLSPFNSNTLFLGTQSGRLYKSININGQPSSLNIGDADFPTANISSIDIGSSENELLVTFSNYGVSSIWYTEDGGLNWEEKESTLPDMPVRWGLLHPDDSNYALIATEIGVWETSNLLDQNVNWLPSSSGLANVRVDMLSMSGDKVLAATHGRGLFFGDFLAEGSLMGDLNNDNQINVLDIIILVNMIINSEDYSNNADINSDTNIDILDVVLMVNLILDN
tara:strand:- start:796 stop:3345 length:2550 start_codon:yes stop_codon:yes gene_type:complete